MYWLSKNLALPRNVFHRDELLTSSLVRSDNLWLRSSPGLILEALSKICSELWLMERRENIGSKYFEFFGSSFGAKVAQEISFRNSLQTIFPWGGFFRLGGFPPTTFSLFGFYLILKKTDLKLVEVAVLWSAQLPRDWELHVRIQIGEKILKSTTKEIKIFWGFSVDNQYFNIVL